MSTINQFIIPAAWMSLIEIAIVLLLVPLMERIVYPLLAQSNIYLPRLWRVAFGMLLIAGSSGMGRKHLLRISLRERKKRVIVVGQSVTRSFTFL